MRYQILDEPPKVEQLKAKGAQLIRVAMKMPIGKCLKVILRNKAEARKTKAQMFDRKVPPLMVPPEGYVWRTVIHKVQANRWVLLVWLVPKSSKSPKSSRATIIETEPIHKVPQSSESMSAPRLPES